MQAVGAAMMQGLVTDIGAYLATVRREKNFGGTALSKKLSRYGMTKSFALEFI
ncbi:hypothetical protein G6L86_18680 [Agrobacterium tumefaciens]|uniref:hypothetical protein n=1 Tax=Agrobacterium tumefaciens TaxID=358 RepID=UPI0015735423|nr:hypothetical protein [Agrobacterium tumefaciens]NSX87633.1 hypothetical protein [Agrobacterium tumefaciens]